MNKYPQDAVYWGPAPADDYGRPQFLSPVAVKVHWEDLSVVFVDKSGREQVSRAKVYAGKDFKWKEGGVLWLGSISGIQANPSPFANFNAWEIRKTERIPSVQATKFVYTAIL